MSLVLPSVQAREGNRVAWQTQWWSSYVFAHKPRLRQLTPLWCDPLSLSLSLSLTHTHTTRKTPHLNSQLQILKLITKHTYSRWFRSARLSELTFFFFFLNSQPCTLLGSQTVVHKMHCTNSNIWVVLFLIASTFRRTNKVLLRSHRNTQCLPDMTASTLLRLLKPSLLFLREHLGCIMQIFPHPDVDMWGCVLMRHFSPAWISLQQKWLTLCVSQLFSQTRNANYSGQRELAEKNSKTARTLNHIGLGIGLVVIVVIIIIHIVIWTR